MATKNLLSRVVKAAKDLLGADGLKNPDSLSGELIGQLAQYLRNLEDPALEQKIVRFLVDGVGEEIVLELGGRADAAKKLGIGAWNNDPKWPMLNQQRSRLIGDHTSAAAAFWMRFGQVLEALERAAGAKTAGPPNWAGWLVALMQGGLQAGYNYQLHKTKKWSADEWARLLPLASLPDDSLVSYLLDDQALAAAFMNNATYYAAEAVLHRSTYLRRHPDAVRSFLHGANATQRTFALAKLCGMSLDGFPLLDLFVELATSSSKNVREAGFALLNTQAEAALPFIEKTLADGNAEQRHEAAQLLWRLLGTAATERLQKHLETESAERVKQTIRKLLAVPDAQSSATEVEWNLPAIAIPRGEVPLPPEAKPLIAAGIEKAYAAAHEQYVRARAEYDSPNRPTWMNYSIYKPIEPAKLGRAEIEEFIHAVETGRDWHDIQKKLQSCHQVQNSWGEWLKPTGIELVHLVRMAFLANILQIRTHGMFWWNLQPLEEYRSRSQPPCGLRELELALLGLPGYESHSVAVTYLASNNKFQSFCDWEPEFIWPIFTEMLPYLRELLNPVPKRVGYSTSYDYSVPQKRINAFKVLGMFPRLPAEFVPVLWDIALGDSKADRPLAQASLATVPDKTPKIIVALDDGKQTVRAAAADWLGRLGDPAAIEPLKKVLRGEKLELVKGALLIALDRLGADVDEFLNRKKLLAEAEEGLAKKRPKGSEWVPLEALPPLHWQDTGKALDPRIAQWWVVQAIQQKSPIPGPIVRRYLAMCRPNETAALAKYLLAAWIGKDTTVVTQEEAAARAKAETDKLWNHYSQYQYFIDMYQNKKENLYQQNLAKFSTAFTGSAIDQKGMLALVAAVGNADCVKMIERYIRDWFGNRLAQCKALIEVLAWISHPQAIQVLLTIANRFRTKALRTLAQEHVEALAEREGWTIDELSDRTIPDGGFARPTDDNDRPIGSDAVLELDYGPRQFQVRLNDDLEPVVTSAEGKPLKNVPAPGKADDAEKAKAAKKAFADAKKSVKEVVKRQSERLYESLCTQRAWKFDDWQRYLANHPIVGRLCVRLVWAAFAPGKDEQTPERFLGCFRPLEDGSLTDEKDDTFTPPADCIVRVAHTCNTPAELEAAWNQHFADYEVEPPFAQFNRPIFVLPADQKNATQIKDFEGHMLTTFKMRGKATKLGYARGQAGDGGWFNSYHKPFSSLGLEAIIEFTGSPLPEEDRPCALTELGFQAATNKSQQSWGTPKLPLSKIPPVLLSEVYNDLKQIAADGAGFDPEWQKKGYY